MIYSNYDYKKKQIKGICSLCKERGEWTVKIYDYSDKHKALKRDKNEAAIICFSDGQTSTKQIDDFLGNKNNKKYDKGFPSLTLLCPNCYRTVKIKK